MCYLDLLLFLKKIYLSLKNRFEKMWGALTGCKPGTG